MSSPVAYNSPKIYVEFVTPGVAYIDPVAKTSPANKNGVKSKSSKRASTA